MWDMYDNPDWLHELLSFMRDGILTTHEEAEAAGDWHLCNHENQSMPCTEELPDPQANGSPVNRNRLWIYVSSQEFEGVSPEMHEEFILQYQLPIVKKFGLVAYGCCENLTKKIDMLRNIPNLRRIAIAPRADVAECAEKIKKDYVLSWRPNPAEMVCCGFDADHIRKVVKNALQAARGCSIDITLKDVHTVQNDPTRFGKWVRIVREIVEK